MCVGGGGGNANSELLYSTIVYNLYTRRSGGLLFSVCHSGCCLNYSHLTSGSFVAVTAFPQPSFFSFPRKWFLWNSVAPVAEILHPHNLDGKVEWRLHQSQKGKLVE